MSQELPVVSMGTSQAQCGPMCLVWALPDKRWATQARDTVPGSLVETGLAGRHVDV